MKGLGTLEGRVRHCVRYKVGTGGKKVCAKYRAGPGRPKGRRKISIKRKFVERSTTKKRASRVCAKRAKRKVKGRRKCLKWRYISKKALKVRRRVAKRSCLKWGVNKLGRRTCKKYRVKGDGRRRRGKKHPLRGKKRPPCVSWGRNRLGRRYCRKYAVLATHAMRKKPYYRTAQYWDPEKRAFQGLGKTRSRRRGKR